MNLRGMNKVTQTIGNHVLSLELCWNYSNKNTILLKKEMLRVGRFNCKILEFVSSNPQSTVSMRVGFLNQFDIVLLLVGKSD